MSSLETEARSRYAPKKETQLRAWLRENGRSLTWLQKQADISWATVCRIANGRPASRETARRLSLITGFPERVFTQREDFVPRAA